METGFRRGILAMRNRNPLSLLEYLGEPPFEPRRQLLGSARGGPDLKDFLQGSRSGIHFRALVPRDAKRDMIANLKAVKGELRSRSLAELACFFKMKYILWRPAPTGTGNPMIIQGQMRGQRGGGARGAGRMVLIPRDWADRSKSGPISSQERPPRSKLESANRPLEVGPAQRLR